MSEENFIQFVLEHADDDPAQLLLSAGRWPGIDVRRAARVIGARRKVREKIPSWYANPGLDYPDSLPLEQCSSEVTARHKQQFVPEGGRIADLTGGLGVDCWFLSRKADEAHYCERNGVLCETARHNFDILEDRPGFRIEIHEGDGVAWLKAKEEHFDLIYLDPARRSKTAKRVYGISDCEPDLLAVKGELLAKASRVLAKISPMADISRTLALFPESKELHVVASGGEVKELLLLLESGPAVPDPEIIVADGRRYFRFK
ncbi:MAG: RsmD family RNA methyltransferase, partial [Bacteroidales bacterium]|nr:RsmD family RNA methyltransferase [Bacteroidales bacterium]